MIPLSTLCVFLSAVLKAASHRFCSDFIGQGIFDKLQNRFDCERARALFFFLSVLTMCTGLVTYHVNLFPLADLFADFFLYVVTYEVFFHLVLRRHK